jgi:membrane protease YdiL (CAAX protease family)
LTGIDPVLRGLLVWRIALPSAAVVVALLVSRLRGLPLGDAFAWRLPDGRQALIWLLAWLAWVGASELLSRALALSAVTPWASRGPAVLVVTAIGMIGIAPFVEELAFRGVFFWRIEQSPLGPAGAIAVTAVVFALLHTQYSAAEMALVAGDALVLGIARWRGRSVPLCFLMHAIGNAYAFAQRMPS